MEATLTVREAVSMALVCYVEHLGRRDHDRERLYAELAHWMREAELGGLGVPMSAIGNETPTLPGLRSLMDREIAPDRVREPLRERAVRDPEFRKALVAGVVSSVMTDDFEAAETILREYLKGLGR